MSDVSMNIGVLKKLSPRLSKRMMVDAVEACKEKQSLEQGGEGGYPYDLSGVDCDNLGKSDNNNSESEAGSEPSGAELAELCAEKEKMEKGEAYDYSYDLSSIDCGKSTTEGDAQASGIPSSGAGGSGGNHNSGHGTGHGTGHGHDHTPGAGHGGHASDGEEPHGADFHPNVFVPDAGCPTGMAVRGSVDSRRRQGDVLPLCVECDLRSLSQIVNCSPGSSEAECCEGAQLEQWWVHVR